MEILGIDVGGSGIKGASVNTETGQLTAKRIRIKTPKEAEPQPVADVVAQIAQAFEWKGRIGIEQKITKATKRRWDMQRSLHAKEFTWASAVAPASPSSSVSNISVHQRRWRFHLTRLALANSSERAPPDRLGALS